MTTDYVSNVNDVARSGNHSEITSIDHDPYLYKAADEVVRIEKIDFTYIDSDLYKAAVEGDIEPFKKNKKHLDLVATTNNNKIKNTILQVNMISQGGKTKSINFVRQILELYPSLLQQVNARGETPLHVASTWGHTEIVEVLINSAKLQHEDLENGAVAAKEMIGLKNYEGNTALHEAARCNSFLVAIMLIQEYPDFSYSANKRGETPLYIAAEKGYVRIVNEILQKCTSPAHQGPQGKSALHAAVMSDEPGTTRYLLEKMNSLTKEKDENGWTPLHYAAYYNHLSHAKLLLKSDSSVAYVGDKQRNMTALHLAAGQGNHRIIDEIVVRCPECCERVDNRGWNFLHFGMVTLSFRQVKNIVGTNLLLFNLLDEKDINGNTPLHVLAAYNESSLKYFEEEMVDDAPTFHQFKKLVKIIKNIRTFRLNDFRGALVEIVEKLTLPYFVFDKFNFTVPDRVHGGFAQLKKEVPQLSEDTGSNGQYPCGVIKLRKIFNPDALTEAMGAKDSHLITAALIATVTFAAAFTVPGGYKSEISDNNRGNAILSKSSAFRAFVITDAIAMVLSLTAVFIHFLMSLGESRRYVILFRYSATFTMLAMVAMVIAFVTGTYAMLSTSLGLAISTCVIGLSFIPFMIFFMNNLEYD